MSSQRLQFKLAQTQKDLRQIYQHNMSAFLDADEFPWSLQWLQQQQRAGQQIYQAGYQEQVVAALFVQVSERGLLTKQTPLRMDFQGLGLGHQIKQFVEELAQQHGLRDIFSYCAIDNFRMVALNESHGYQKTGERLEGAIVEWHKQLRD